MKKLSQKGFTLIELLAVITIMGILMLVAIPAISRTIENTRRDTFADTAKNYANSVRTMWLSDSLTCRTYADGDTIEAAPSTPASGVPNGDYYVLINSAKQGTNVGTATTNKFKPFPFLLQQGGKSSWGNADVTGVVKITVSGAGTTATKQTYSVAMSDGTHGITEFVNIDDLKRANVLVSGAARPFATTIAAGTALPASILGTTGTAIQEHLCQES